MHATWGMGLQSGDMPARGGARLWTAFVRPILEYGAEIWGREADNKWAEAERLQKEMGVKILRCSGKVADAFVMGELGWWTLKARRTMLRLAALLGKLVRMDEARVVKKVYRESKRDHDEAEAARGEARGRRRRPREVRNWCSYTHQLLREVGLGEHWSDLETVRDEGAWRKLVHDAIAKTEQARWRADVEGNKVLQVYAQLKPELGWETYLDGHEDPTGRMGLARLRSGRHGLAVNTGRFAGSKVPRDERYCEWCKKWDGQTVVEDESHLLLTCPRYASEGLEMLGGTDLEGLNGDGSMKAMRMLIGRGPVGETSDQMATRHKETKRFVRRALRLRSAEG
jgi:hypothetical protein